MAAWRTWLGVAATLLALLGSIFFVEDRYASTEDVVMVKAEVTRVEARLDYKIKYDQAMGLKQNLWELTAHYCEVPRYCQQQERTKIPHPVQRRIAGMKAELQQLERELATMRKNGH